MTAPFSRFDDLELWSFTGIAMHDFLTEGTEVASNKLRLPRFWLQQQVRFGTNIEPCAISLMKIRNSGFDFRSCEEQATNSASRRNLYSAP